MERKILVFGLVALTGLLVLLGKQGLGTEAEEAVSSFAEFRSAFGKSYSSLAEMEHRLGVFRANLDLITRHNADVSQTYTLGVNKHADLTFEEFSAFYLSDNPEDKYVDGQEVSLPLVRNLRGDYPWDWRKRNIIGPVRDQGECGSSWAFAATSVIEEAYARFGKIPPPILSAQELVDCSQSFGNKGCNGGLSSNALDYVLKLGINLEKDYPDTAKDSQCNDSLSGKGQFKIEFWRTHPGGPWCMSLALYFQPTTASMRVQNDFRFYKSGVYNPVKCPGVRNHSINVVGFDFDAEIPFFIARNSWGTSWGEDGFFRIAASEENGTCWFTGQGHTLTPKI